MFNECGEGRIRDEAPVHMPGVGEELKFVAMEPVSAVGEQVKDSDGGCDG